MLEIDLTHLEKWKDKVESKKQLIDEAYCRRLAGAIGSKANVTKGAVLPAPWHWSFFLPETSASNTDIDGHEKRGGFLPPVPLPRRMWAGNKVKFYGSLRIGDCAEKRSRVSSISLKNGRSGQLVFVVVNHQIFVGDKLTVDEDQTIVYRDAPNLSSAPAEISKPDPYLEIADDARVVHPNPVLLFRYSALTYNSHRIHYDREYAVKEEGYPGLVVHGPLLATLLLDHLNQVAPEFLVRKFSFKAVRPLFDTHDFTLNCKRDGSSALVWAADHLGQLAMEMTVNGT